MVSFSSVCSMNQSCAMMREAIPGTVNGVCGSNRRHKMSVTFFPPSERRTSERSVFWPQMALKERARVSRSSRKVELDSLFSG